ncbi:MAG: HAMP domain-containing sensor histidine kinase [Bacteroidota bacterium]
MKFLTKFNRNYLLLFSCILIVLSFSGYFILKAIILENTKESLLSQETLIKKQIAETNHIPYLKPVIEVTHVNGQTSQHPQFREITIMNVAENEEEVYIEYSDIINVNNIFYLLKIRAASLENEDLALSIAVAIFTLLLTAFAISFVITKRLNKTIWNNFEYNLKEIENFDLRENQLLQFRSSNIDEFDRLNTVIKNLTNKLKKDFLALKEFTENASHEIQSPLTIASLNLEEILQQELNEDSFRKVVTAINALKRLSILNQNLVLLTKIENNQFSANDFIVLNELIQHKIQEFELLFKERNIQVSYSSESDFHVKMNIYLAEILINNLLSNAINHNVDNGSINITINHDEVAICNTGTTSELNNENIFNRFVKGNSKSYGLGLAIVKQICNTHSLEIQYSKNDFHCFTMSKKN